MGERKPPYVTGLYSWSAERSRWDVPVLFRDLQLARLVQARLAGVPQLGQARATSLTGRVLVGHRVPLSPDEVRALLERALREAVESADLETAASWSESPFEAPARQVAINPVYKLAGVVVLGAVVVSAVEDALETFSPAAVWTGVGFFAASTAVLVRVARERAKHVDKQVLRSVPELVVAMRPYHARLTSAVMQAVASRALYVLQMSVVGLTIDKVVSPEDTRWFRWKVDDTNVGIWSMAGAVSLLAASSSLLDFTGRVQWTGAAHEVMHDLRMALLDHVMHLEVSQLDERSRGSFLALIGEDINRLKMLFDTLWEALSDLSGTLTTAAGFFLVTPAFAGIVALPVPLIVGLGIWLQGRLGPRYDAVRDSAASLGGVLSSALDGALTARSFNAEEQVESWVGTASLAFKERQRAAVRLSSAYVPILKAIATATRSLVVLSAGGLVQKGTLTPGIYVMTTLLSTHVALPLMTIGSHLSIIQGALASLNHVFAAFKTPTERALAGRPLPLDEVEGELLYDRVSFRYADGSEVLRSLTLSIAAGRTTAVVGATGSGKSTLVKLLLRFYDIEGGRMLFDGQEVRSLRPVDLRRAVGYVSQDVFLFDGTIRDNIALGRPDASDEEVAHAARLAGAHQFIRRAARGLPHARRRAWPEALGRGAAAHRHRPRAAGRPPDGGARRGDLRARQRDRGGAHGASLTRASPGGRCW